MFTYVVLYTYFYNLVMLFYKLNFKGRFSPNEDSRIPISVTLSYSVPRNFTSDVGELVQKVCISSLVIR